MKSKVVLFAVLLVLGACDGSAPSPAADARDADQWFAFDHSVSGKYSAVNFHKTALGFAGRLVKSDGSALPLRAIEFSGDGLSFIVPGLGASYSAQRLADGDWAGEWIDTDGASAAALSDSTASPALSEGQLVEISDGRRMHMVCAGEGAPVVVFDYGAGGAIKKDWNDIATAIAAKAQTRTCVYDRAGRGLSDPGAMPRDAAAVVSDLDEMLGSANVPPPYVLVGHSLGSYHVRLYANVHPERTAGLVLVDPSGDGQSERFNAVIPKVQAMQDAALRAQRELNCIARLRDAPIAPSDPLAVQCGGNDPEAIEATASEIAEMAGASTDQLTVSRRAYNDMPLIVLTRTDYEKGMPPDFSAEDKQAMRTVWEAMHSEMASLSDQGRHIFVPGAGHYIQLDAPQAVIDATAEVVAAVRTAADGQNAP